MNCSYIGVLMDETPGEISLTFKFTGCPVGCPDCQAKEYWDPKSGHKLKISDYIYNLNDHMGKATAVLFMGGEWNKELDSMLVSAKMRGFKTILYTGKDISEISHRILSLLDYIKYGPYDDNCGGLDSPTTNQVYKNLNTGEILNEYFLNKF